MTEKHIMQIAYDAIGDVLYLSVGEPRPAISREAGDDILVRIDPETQEVVGLTILNLSTRGSIDDLPIRANLQAIAQP
ncbi:MAG: DUF2283 domain-containing protein [Anaerolineae bacterium]|nr:DUF2283 domain-containing protein [Anaerolineae bacterium]NUQ03497.1 DUF2283 domain-containing protein [Anaerolineae bacterium]